MNVCVNTMSTCCSAIYYTAKALPKLHLHISKPQTSHLVVTWPVCNVESRKRSSLPIILFDGPLWQ